MVKNISAIEVEALPQNIPHEIKVSIELLKTFEDRIAVKDLILPQDVEINLEPEEVIALVTPPQDVEKELAEEIEENVEGVEKIEKEKDDEVIDDETPEAK